MTNNVYHTHDFRSCLFLYLLVELVEAQSVEGSLLAGRTVDSAHHLLDFDFSHVN